MAIADALLGLATGAAGVINDDAQKNRDFMRKHKAKINESRLIRQEKAHDAKKAQFNAKQEWGTGDTGILIHATKVLGSVEAAKEALRDPGFVASMKHSLEGAKDPGVWVPDEVQMSDEDYRAQYGSDTIGSRLLGKFSAVGERRKDFRKDQAAGEAADTAAIASQVTAPTEAGGDGFEEPSLTSLIEKEVDPLEIKSTLYDVMLDGKAAKLGQSKGGKWVHDGKEIDAGRVTMIETDPGLDTAVEVLYQGKKTFANQDKFGKWRINGEELPPGAITPLDDKPSSRMERINLLRKVNIKINETTDPVELAMLEDEKSVLLDTTTAAARAPADLRSKRELGIQDKLGAFEITEYNLNTLATDITAEMGGPNAFIAKWKDNLDAYVTGIHGSDVTPQDIIFAYSDIDGTAEEKKARHDKISTAYKTGSAEFIFETMKYSIANMLKEGQKLSTFDNKKVDDMFEGTWGTDLLAGKLNEALKMVALQKDRQVFNIMLGRGIRKADITPVTIKGVRTYWYPSPDGKLQQFVY